MVMRTLAKKPHVPIDALCGVCGGIIDSSSKFVVLSGNADSTALGRRLPAHWFSGPGSMGLIDKDTDTYVCRMQNCGVCQACPESVTTHEDCLDVFLAHFGQKWSDKTQAETETETRALQLLWLTGTWRSPWRYALRLFLFASHDLAPVPAADVLQRLGLAGLGSLAPETVLAIKQASDGSALWRLSGAVELATELAELAAAGRAQEDLTSVPLLRVQSWVRGPRPPVLVGSAAEALPYVRLTIDAGGLAQVERLATRPVYRRQRSDRLAFVVCAASQLQGVVMRLRLGRARLRLPKDSHGLPIWDTPTPPVVRPDSFYTYFPGDATASSRFYTVDLEASRGLTFVFDSEAHSLLYIHSHTDAEPSADVSVARLPDKTTMALTWTYLPLSQADHITALGLRKERDLRNVMDDGTDHIISIEYDENEEAEMAAAAAENEALAAAEMASTLQRGEYVRESYTDWPMLHNMALLIRTSLAGPTAIGEIVFGEPETRMLTHEGRGRPTTLVYSVEGYAPITAMGVIQGGGDDVQDGHDAQVANVLPFPRPRNDDEQIDGVFFATAPLTGVTRVEVFEDADTGWARGLLLTYGGGGGGSDAGSSFQRTLGSCRVGDSKDVTSKVYDAPVCIRFCEVRESEEDRGGGDAADDDYYDEADLYHDRTRVEAPPDVCSSSSDNGSGPWDWTCCPLSGRLEAFFVASQFYLKYSENEDSDDDSDRNSDGDLGIDLDLD